MLAICRLAVFALLALAAFAGPASAIDTGTPAWLIHTATLNEGPGRNYDIVGELPAKSRIRVDRCSRDWCQIHAEGQRGWVRLYSVAFGQEPRAPLTGPRLNYPSGLGTVCFYTGQNYTGSVVCNDSGYVMTDLLLVDLDNTFSSVQIEGAASVTACRDRNFQSYCERIVESQPVLHGFLDDGLTSYRIW
jgi:uncharacterized protein YraI